MTKSKTEQKVNLKKSLEKLQEITEWFQEEELDLDQGLEKLREGVELIKICRSKIGEIENEFITIKKELADEESNMTDQSEIKGTDMSDDMSIDSFLDSLN